MEIRTNLPGLEIEALSCHSAGVISGQTSFADVGPHSIDRARRRDADVPNKGRTAIAVTSHAAPLIIDVGAGDEIEVGVSFQ
jgi:hypothetical protein